MKENNTLPFFGDDNNGQASLAAVALHRLWMLLGGVAPFIICPKITNKLYIFMTRRPDSCRSWTHVNQSSTIDPTCASVWCQVWDKCVCVCAFCTYARSFSFITRRFRQPYLKKKSSLLTVLFFPFLSHRMTPQPRNYWHGSLSFDSLPRRLNWGSRRKKKAKKKGLFIYKATSIYLHYFNPSGCSYTAVS